MSKENWEREIFRFHDWNGDLSNATLCCRPLYAFDWRLPLHGSKLRSIITEQTSDGAKKNKLILILFLQQLQEFNSITIYCCCAYVIISLISIGLLFNHNSLFYWLEMVRCLIFLGYSIYRPIEVDSIVLNIFLYTVRLFYLYSAWMCRHECVKAFSSATEQKMKWSLF
jgi:hypothetical protein